MRPGLEMKNFKVLFRLSLGFAVILLLLAIVVSSTLVEVGKVKESTDRIVNLRTPTARASARMTSAINVSLASLRGCPV